MPQNLMTQLRPTHPVRSLEMLAKVLALPGEHTPQRFPSFPALERTALIGFTQPASLNLDASIDTKIMVCRQAAYPAWGEVACTAPEALMVSYQSADPQNVIGISARDTAILDNPLQFYAGNRGATTLLPAVTASVVRTPYPIMAVDSRLGAKPFMYVPSGWSLTFAISFAQVVNGTGGSSVLEYEIWDSPGQATQAKVTIPLTAGVQGAAATPIVFSAGNCWVRPTNIDYSTQVGFTAGATLQVHIHLLASPAPVSYTGAAASAGAFAIGSTSVFPKSLMPLVYPSEISTSPLPWNSTRLTAVAGLFSNVTQILNKAGTVMAGRLNPTTWNPFITQKLVVNNLHPSEKAFLPLETGLYTYCPPSTDMMDFWDYTANTTNVITTETNSIPLYRLDNTSLVNVAFFNPGSVDASLAINITWHLEFRTTSALFQIGMSPLTLESLHQSQLALSQVGFFFDNPDHRAIVNGVLKALRVYAPIATTALEAGVNAYNAYNAPSSAPRPRRKGVGRTKRARANRKTPRDIKPKTNSLAVPPTSAAKSGITKPKMRGGLEIYMSRNR